MGRRTAPTTRMAAAQEHAAARAIVPESTAAFACTPLQSAPEYKRPTWWPSEGDEHLISVAADAFDGDWEWVQSPRQRPGERAAQRDEESEAAAAGPPVEQESEEEDNAAVVLQNISGQNDLAELYRLACMAPPQCVVQVIGAVCIALGVPPQPSANNRRGSYFTAGRKLLHDSSDLLFRLFSFDASELLADPARRSTLRKAVAPLTVEVVAKKCLSAVGLVQWLHAVVSSADAAERRAVTRRTATAASRSGRRSSSATPAAGSSRPRRAGAHYGLQNGPPWCAWEEGDGVAHDDDDEKGQASENSRAMMMPKTSDDYCGWAVDGVSAGRRQPPKRYSAIDAKAVARQNQAEVLAVNVPTVSVSRADYPRHPPSADPRPKPPLDLTLLHLGTPDAHNFRGSTETKDGLYGPGSAGWSARTGRPAGALGVQILGGDFHELIPGGAELPAEASQRFSLSHNDQREACILVLESPEAGAVELEPIPASTALGEGLPQSRKLLTTLDLVGLPPSSPSPAAKPREPTIELAFYLSSRGKLTVAVRDLRTGRQQRWSE